MYIIMQLLPMTFITMERSETDRTTKPSPRVSLTTLKGFFSMIQAENHGIIVPQHTLLSASTLDLELQCDVSERYSVSTLSVLSRLLRMAHLS